jgi:hypothetical protein
MKKTKAFKQVHFDDQAICQCRDAFLAEVDDAERQSLSMVLSAETGDERWEYDSEDELFADIRRGVDEYSYRILGGGYDLIIAGYATMSRSVVSLKSRAQIERVFTSLEGSVGRCMVPIEECQEEQHQPSVFIGHGRSAAWRDLKDHLQDQHGFRVVAYEIGARAGHTIRDILEEMLGQASIAFLVMTGEDVQEDGAVRSRQNVVHEVGLFQGRLGFPRGVVLLEEGAEEFSNLHGIQQIRFSKNSIRETFGDVLATIRREFESDDS